MQSNKTRFFYVLYSDKIWVFDQSERVQGPIYILILRRNPIEDGAISGFSGQKSVPE